MGVGFNRIKSSKAHFCRLGSVVSSDRNHRIQIPLASGEGPIQSGRAWPTILSEVQGLNLYPCPQLAAQLPGKPSASHLRDVSPLRSGTPAVHRMRPPPRTTPGGGQVRRARARLSAMLQAPAGKAAGKTCLVLPEDVLIGAVAPRITTPPCLLELLTPPSHIRILGPRVTRHRAQAGHTGPRLLLGKLHPHPGPSSHR